MKKNRSIIYGIIITLMVTLILLGSTYAYYRTKIIGNSGDKSIKVNSKNLSVTYGDGSGEVTPDEKIEPGYNNESNPKTFTVQNTGGGEAEYSIIFDEISNNFSRIEDWTFELKKDDKIIKTGMIPSTTSYVINKVKIVGGETDNYSLTIKYAESTEDQSIDMGKKLEFRVNISNAIETTMDKEENQNTLLYAIGRDNLIVLNPLTVPGKEISKLTYESSKISDSIETFKVDSQYQNYYWTYGEGYEYDVNTKKFKLTVVNTGIYKNIKDILKGKYLVSNSASSNSSQTDDLKKTMGLGNVYKVESTTDNEIKYRRILPKGIEAELTTTEDDDGISYYYRGIVDNNYATMGNTCWRIVRVQGNGSIKITLYDETHDCANSDADSRGAFLSEGGSGEPKIWSSYNNSSNKNTVKFDLSDVRNLLEEWYENLYNSSKRLSIYSKIIEQEAQWCTDVSVVETNESGLTLGSSYRLDGKDMSGPSLKCPETESVIGSSKYIGKIGLLTADEIVFAGSGVHDVCSYYLMDNSFGDYLSLTPTSASTAEHNGTFWTPMGIGGIWHQGYRYGGYVRPTLVLKSNVTISEGGTGTKTNPYVISTN